MLVEKPENIRHAAPDDFTVIQSRQRAYSVQILKQLEKHK
jgi:hypothetical protein